MMPFNCFDLPDAFIRVLLAEWFGLKHVVRLDSAFCCRESRKQFASLAYGQQTTFAVKSMVLERRIHRLLPWAITRGARLDGLCFCDSDVSSKETLQLLESFLVTHGSAVRRIYDFVYDAAPHQIAVLLFARWCPNVAHFQGECSRHSLQWDKYLIALTTASQNLTTLSLSNVKLSKEGFAEALRQCVALEHLEVLTACQIIPREAAIPSLKSLKSASCCVSDALLIALGQRCAKLETLVIFQYAEAESDHQVTDVGVRAVLEGCPLLRETDVKYAAGLSPELRIELMRRLCPRYLYLGLWVDMNDNLAQKMLRVCPGLKALMFSGCEWLTDATLAVCAQHCPHVWQLTLPAESHITAAGVTALVIKLGSTLRSLDFYFCSCLGDEVVLAIAEHCSLLEYLRCPSNVSDAVLMKLKERCVKLK
jgi:hypothetical protein